MKGVSRVVVASQNDDKVAEVESVLAEIAPHVVVVRGLRWDDVDETETTLAGNAFLKARAVAAATGIAALADDTGLEVAALDWGPGVRTARYAGDQATYSENVDKLLAALDGVADRRARFRTAVAFVSPYGDERLAEGTLEGTIATDRRGDGGFGYDPVFEVDGRTLAEMTIAEKNRVSHRARALRAMAELLAADATERD